MLCSVVSNVNLSFLGYVIDLVSEAKAKGGSKSRRKKAVFGYLEKEALVLTLSRTGCREKADSILHCLSRYINIYKP